VGKACWILAALLFAGCHAPGATPGTSADEADRVALAASPGGPNARVVGTRRSTFGVEAPTSYVADASTVVWAVSLTGVFEPVSCGPAMTPPATPGPCPSPQTTELVLINASTGAFIMGELPDPGESASP